MAYSEKVLDHYENPRNVGVFDKDEEGIGTGMVGAPACGDVMRLQIKGEEVMLARTGNGYLEDPSIWSYEVMMEMALEDGFELTESQVMQIEKAREYYVENSSVPPIRTFAKYVGIDKGKLFKEWLTGPLKPITKYGGLPQPTGCV